MLPLSGTSGRVAVPLGGDALELIFQDPRLVIRKRRPPVEEREEAKRREKESMETLPEGDDHPGV